MRSFLWLLFVSGCFGAGDDIKIGHGTGRYRGWDSAACSCDVRTDFRFVGQTVQLGCTPMFDGYGVSTTLAFPVPGQRNTVARVQVADFFDEYALGVAAVEVSSEVDEAGRLAVWIDQLVVAPHSMARPCTNTTPTSANRSRGEPSRTRACSVWASDAPRRPAHGTRRV